MCIRDRVVGNVKDLLESRDETQIMSSQLSPEAINEVEAVLKKHGATVKSVSHPTSTLEDLFLRTVEESKARPGRRFAPGEAPGRA